MKLAAADSNLVHSVDTIAGFAAITRRGRFVGAVAGITPHPRVLHPFQNIADHVIQAPGIRAITADLGHQHRAIFQRERPGPVLESAARQLISDVGEARAVLRLVTPEIAGPARHGNAPGSLTLLASLWLRLCDTVKEAFAAQVEFTANQRRGSTERVVEVVDSQRGVFAVMAQDDGCSITPGDIDAASRADWRCKDEIGNPFKSERFAARFAGRGFKP